MNSTDIIAAMRSGSRLFWGVCGPYLINGKQSTCRNANIHSVKSLARQKLIQRVVGTGEWKLVRTKKP